MRAFLPEALRYYQPSSAKIELLPSAALLDSPTAKAERELLKRIQAINRFAEAQNGERAVVEALAYELRTSGQSVFQERQQLQVGYGQYAALRGVWHLGRGSIQRIADDYRHGQSWSEITSNGGTRLGAVLQWLAEVMRVTHAIGRPLTDRQLRPNFRAGP